MRQDFEQKRYRKKKRHFILPKEKFFDFKCRNEIYYKRPDKKIDALGSTFEPQKYTKKKPGAFFYRRIIITIQLYYFSSIKYLPMFIFFPS